MEVSVPLHADQAHSHLAHAVYHLIHLVAKIAHQLDQRDLSFPLERHTNMGVTEDD